MTEFSKKLRSALKGFRDAGRRHRRSALGRRQQKLPLAGDRSSLRVAYYVLLILGIAALGYAGYVVADEHAYQAVQDWRLDHTGKNTHLRLVVDGMAIGRMEIPRLGVKAVVVQGDSARILRRAVGHLPNTALPGESGNVVVAGHRDTFFRRLRHVRKGDAITFSTPDGRYEYVVESTEIVPPTRVQVLESSRQPSLTLITCYPFDYVGSAPNRFIVRALEVKRPGQQPARPEVQSAL
jgi:sortase A